MGKLSDWSKNKSPFLKIEIDEETPPMIYKSFKEVAGKFGDTIRYTFEYETDNGLVSKSWDCAMGYVAEKFDEIAFGKTVSIKRYKVEGKTPQGNDRSAYEIKVWEV